MRRTRDSGFARSDGKQGGRRERPRAAGAERHPHRCTDSGRRGPLRSSELACRSMRRRTRPSRTGGRGTRSSQGHLAWKLRRFEGGPVRPLTELDPWRGCRASGRCSPCSAPRFWLEKKGIAASPAPARTKRALPVPVGRPEARFWASELQAGRRTPGPLERG